MYVGDLGGHSGDSAMVVLDGVDTVGIEQANTSVDNALEIYTLMAKLDSMYQIHKEYYDVAVQQQWWILAGIFFISGMLPIMCFLIGKGGGNDA
uniref:hypothetical protein n=1 Tax=Paenibacillus popilliae TaxID=78057 RepID=UPI001866A76D|nr:hypothetical protein [Paenibacillus popilliae]